MYKKRSRSSQHLQLQINEEGTTPLSPPPALSSSSSSKDDVFNMLLLVILYAMQGVPLGLTLGSIPFILKAHASYTEVGFFSLASYPYSIKLIWSPIVDTVFSSKIGWRKSWILPIQMASGLLMVLFAEAANEWLEIANVKAISTLFFIFVLLAATQDIAVDGWALTLLSRKNVGHASTCQTIGMNIGYFLSFTIFLALNDADFCNSYLRTTPKPKGILSLAQYFYFWGWFYIIVTILLIFKPEKPYYSVSGLHTMSFRRTSSEQFDGEAGLHSEHYKMNEIMNGRFDHSGRFLDSKLNGSGSGRTKKGTLLHGMGESILHLTHQGRVKQMYWKLWAVISLPNMRKLTVVLLMCKLGSITAETAGIFKLMEKGVSQETVSLVVLIEFPLEVVFAIFAGRWASNGRPFSPWLFGYFLRLGMAAVTTFLVVAFPTGATFQDAPFFYFSIVLAGITTSFSSTLMFVSQGTFFAGISDSSMGGTYLTLLNTMANFGFAWPKFFVFLLIDFLTFQQCVGPNPSNGDSSLYCPMKAGPAIDNPCTDAGGTCVTILDGFYPLSMAMVAVGLFIGIFCVRTLHEIEMVRIDSWRA